MSPFYMIGAFFVALILNVDGLLVASGGGSQAPSSGSSNAQYMAMLNRLLQEITDRMKLEKTVLNLKQKESAAESKIHTSETKIKVIEANQNASNVQMATVKQQTADNHKTGLEVKQKVSTIEGNVKNVENQLNSLTAQLATIVKDNKQKEASMQQYIQTLEGRILSLEHQQTTLRSDLQTAIRNMPHSSTPVGITAYLKGGTVNKGTILTPSTKYGNIHGTGNLPGGQFTCRIPGMYIVMVTVVSNAFQAKFDIYKNSDIIAEGYVAEHPNQNEHDYFHSGTAVTTIQLNTNDKISVRTGKTMLVGDKSSISIVKIG